MAMLARFNNIATGIVGDVDVYDLPATQEALIWSDGNNIRFADEYVEKIQGHGAVFGTASVTPYWMLPVPTASTYYWLYPGLAKVYVTDGSTHTNITRQTAAVDVDYTGTADDIWNGGIISGVPVINNGIDDPQMWTPVNTSTKLASLTWSSGQTWSSQSKLAKVIRPFKNYLIALDMTESGTRYSDRLRWSTSTISGVPSTWDDTDATEDAGYTELNQSGGFFIDCLPLRNANIIYKESETWIQTEIGGNDIFRFEPVFAESGALARRCIKPFFSRHLVLSAGDLILHDGQSIESVIEKRMKTWLFNAIDDTYYNRSFIVPNYTKKEMWVCFPQTGSTFADTALIWNYHDNRFFVRDLPNTPHIAYGIVDPSESQTWASDSQAWGNDATSWDYRSYNPTISKLLMCSGTSFYQGDYTEQFAGSSFTSYIERLGIDLGDPTRRKFVKRIYPRMTSTGSVTIKVGYQDTKNGSVTYSSTTFDPSTDEYADFMVNGKYIAIRFESASNISWKLHSFDVEYEIGGQF